MSYIDIIAKAIEAYLYNEPMFFVLLGSVSTSSPQGDKYTVYMNLDTFYSIFDTVYQFGNSWREIAFRKWRFLFRTVDLNIAYIEIIQIFE